jgi:hypothetical protein
MLLLEVIERLETSVDRGIPEVGDLVEGDCKNNGVTSGMEETPDD